MRRPRARSNGWGLPGKTRPGSARWWSRASADGARRLRSGGVFAFVLIAIGHRLDLRSIEGVGFGVELRIGHVVIARLQLRFDDAEIEIVIADRLPRAGIEGAELALGHDRTREVFAHDFERGLVVLRLVGRGIPAP